MVDRKIKTNILLIMLVSESEIMSPLQNTPKITRYNQKKQQK